MPTTMPIAGAHPNPNPHPNLNPSLNPSPSPNQERGLALVLDFRGFSLAHLYAVRWEDIRRGVAMLQVRARARARASVKVRVRV